MPKININAAEESKRAKRDAADAFLWPLVVAAGRDAIEQGHDAESVVFVLSQYLKGQNPGVKASALRDMVGDELETEGDDNA